MQATDRDDADAARLGFTPERDLLQMRVHLPLPADIVAGTRPVVTRPFVPGRDDEAWLTINNLAFADHPEQGAWTLEDLHERTSAEWFDPEAFLVADSEDGTGLIGSCWDKVHLDSTPVMGEIYVISVNPARHGEGWGRALTVAGLAVDRRQGHHHRHAVHDRVEYTGREALHLARLHHRPCRPVVRARSARPGADRPPDPVGHPRRHGRDQQLAQRRAHRESVA